MNIFKEMPIIFGCMLVDIFTKDKVDLDSVIQNFAYNKEVAQK